MLRTADPPDPGTEPSQSPPLLGAAARRLKSRRDELGSHAGEVEQLVRELADDVDVLAAQEAWDPATASGMQDWAADRGNVFRALRRAHFDQAKAHASLLTSSAARAERQLFGVIPEPPSSHLFTMLPLSQTDRLGHPVAVLTLRDVARDDAGSLADLKDWVWFGLEMVRRVLADYWVSHRHGTGAEGAVLLVDAKGAGCRNLEVELLPTLFSVGHDSFPGVFETVYVVNAGWTHRTMWNTVVKRVLPRSAIEKVVFLDSSSDTAQVFNLDSLPEAYGGQGLNPDPEIMLRRYSIARPQSYSRPGSRATSRAPSRGPSRTTSRAGSRSRAASRERDRFSSPSRNTSMSSIADVYYTAPPSPVARSRPVSRRGSALGLSRLASRLAMTRQDDDEATDKPEPTGDAESSTLQHIKSLSNFHLYLSPSRLANRDLLSDSEDDEPAPARVPPPPVIQRRLTLRPAVLEIGSIAARRAASRANGIHNGTLTNSSGRVSTPAEYASRLQEHHARGLEQYCSAEHLTGLGLDVVSSPEHSDPENHDTPPKTSRETSESPPASPGDSVDDEVPHLVAPQPQRAMLTDHAPATASEAQPAEDVQFSSANPWFGYPVVRVPQGEGYAIRPRYTRNRKRDLVKTLLWLFLLRLQTWRDALERALGLSKIVALFSSRTPEDKATPTEGLRKVAQQRSYAPSNTVAKRTDRDWIWMVIGFLLFRGTWTRMLLAPFDAAGLTGLREMLGIEL